MWREKALITGFELWRQQIRGLCRKNITPNWFKEGKVRAVVFFSCLCPFSPHFAWNKMDKWHVLPNYMKDLPPLGQVLPPPPPNPHASHSQRPSFGLGSFDKHVPHHLCFCVRLCATPKTGSAHCCHMRTHIVLPSVVLLASHRHVLCFATFIFLFPPPSSNDLISNVAAQYSWGIYK